MEELLDHIEKQVVLYTKGHFKVTDTIDDLKVFASKQYWLDINRLEIYTLYHMVSEIFFKLQEEKFIKASLRRFIQGLFTYETPKIDQIIMIQKMLLEIERMKTKGLNLGEADYELFPSLKK